MLHDNDRMAKVFYNEIFVNDNYQLRHLVGKSFVRTIIDIGANCGFFSVFARSLFPNARIIAVEPSPIAFELLEQNTKYLNIETHNIGLGDGSFIDMKYLKGDGTGGGYSVLGGSVRTKRLSSMCRTWKIDPNDNLVLKIDCESAERFLIHEEEEDILLRAVQWSMEVHFGDKWPDCFPFSFWSKWLDKMQKEALSRGLNPTFLRRRTIEKYGVGIVVQYN